MPLVEARDHFCIEILFPDVIVEGLVRVDGAADKLVRLDNASVFQFYPFRLAVFHDDPLDHAAADYPASMF